MAVDLSSLSNQMVTAQALSNLILVWPQQNKGIQAQSPLTFGNKKDVMEKFLFHYEGEQTVTLESDITDSYVEENYAINDHISLAPDLITTTGFYGELTDAVPEALEGLKQAADKLTVIGAYQPVLSTTAQKVFNAAYQAYLAAQIIARVNVKSWDAISGVKSNGATTINAAQSAQEIAANVDSTQNNQQLAFQKFYAYRRNRTLFTVQTPWAIFENCAIQTLVATQAEDTQLVSSFQITFKPILVASTQSIESTDFNIADFQGRSAEQAASNQNLGETAVNNINSDGYLGVDTNFSSIGA